MAQQKFTLALNAAALPQLTKLQQRPVIVGGMDNKLRDPSTSNTSNQENNPNNLPQVIYCENTMPIPEGGMMSVGYTKIQDAGSNSYFDDLYILRDADENEWYFCPARGYNFVVGAIGDAWVSTSPLAARPVDPTTERFSIAYVNGVTYICYAGLYIGHWDGATETFDGDIAQLQGVAITDIRAIAGAGNYLILFCYDNSIKWSSLVDPLDFVSSELTGAGSQIPLDIRGAVLAGSPMSGGFLIHCRHNTVAAIYTNNSAQPWIFREVKNGGGWLSKAYFARDSSQGVIFAYTTYGLQTLGLREAESIHPTVNDFLGGKVYESFDPVTKQVMINTESSNFNIKVASLLNRYLIISYGLSTETSYFAAHVYDLVTKRWGKLNHDHIDVFSVKSGFMQANVMMLTETGEIYRVTLDYTSSIDDDGVLILGRYQLNRTHQICSQELELEVLRANEHMTVNVASNFNGSTVGEIITMLEHETTDTYRKFQGQVEGENITYIIEGNYTLATALATVSSGARM